MKARLHSLFFGAAIALLVGCGGGGGSDDSPPPAQPPSGGGAIIDPSRPAVAYADAEQIFPFITAATIPADGQAVVEFQLTDQNSTAITDLQANDIRLIVSKLESSPIGNLTGNWQSYINRIEQPGVGPGSQAALQATTESGSRGEFTNNGDGTYRYRFASSVKVVAPDIAAQADTEGLNLAYEPQRSHRVAMQFSNARQPANPYYDWVPATGITDPIFHYDVAATSNCNRCHDQLALHGGGRTEVKYCVTCHNPGSTDANSGNSVDMKVMIHKIHMGAQLPSVQDGGEYAIWGFSDTKHDYSGVKYPQDIRNCVNCHVGTGTDPGEDTLQLTSQGDNWSQHAGRAACGSCHDDLDFNQHYGGQSDDSNCMSCHGIGGVADTIASSHALAVDQARAQFGAEVLSIENTAAGEFPVVSFRVFNPVDDTDYDIFNDSPWTQDDGASRLAVTLGWSTSDYTNSGNGEEDASTVSIDALANAVANGDGSYRVTSSTAIPDGSLAPNIPATGSGVAVIEGHPAADLDGSGELQQIPLTNSVGFYSIDEVDGQAVPRRQSVILDNCLHCHQTLVLHGNNRNDNIDSCVSCHNPRNTDGEVRAVAAQPPTDGKDEESLDFKTMVHGIHAASMRDQALQIVGFSGFTTYVYNEEEVHYPGQLGNCLACHNEQGFQLPLADSVLGTTVDTGADLSDPRDDTVVTPIAAACSSCHDGASSKAHMSTTGGASFATSQAAIDSGLVQEQCTLCHGPGRSSDVSQVHSLLP